MPPIRIIDVGAASIGEKDRYEEVLKLPGATLVGFEPHEPALLQPRAEGDPWRTHLPHFVGDGTARTFYECNAPVTSSLLPPNTKLIDKFQALGEYMKVVSTKPVETMRLDEMPETAGADYLKIDVQGGELMVLNGAVERLREIVVIQTEVEVASLYEGQPLFAEIDQFLRAQGFLFHRLLGVSGRTFKPFFYKDAGTQMSQGLWSEAVYVKDFGAFPSMRPATLLKIAAILHHAYRSLDLAGVALEAHDATAGTTYQQDYIKRFSAPGANIRL